VDEERTRDQWMIFPGWGQCFKCPSVLSYCWLDDSKGFWFIKTCAANPEKFFSETSVGKVTGNWQPQFHLEQL